MPDEVKLQCPSCHADVKLGDIECPRCGVNLKSGESYETRVKQAKGKNLHPEHFGGRIGLAVGFGLAVVLFAGYMWESSVRKLFGERPELFRPALEELQAIDDMIVRVQAQRAAGETAAADKAKADAARRADALEKSLLALDNEIKPDVPYTKAPATIGTLTRKEKPFNQTLAKRQLKNLRAKVLVRVERIQTI